MGTMTALWGAVADELEAATFSLEITVSREYVPRRELASLTSDVLAIVAPGTVLISNLDRGRIVRDAIVQVGLQCAVADLTAETVDPLVDLAEEVADYFRALKLDSMPAARWWSAEHTQLYLPEHADQFLAFTSIISLTYKILEG
jgi:hypothetical protein